MAAARVRQEKHEMLDSVLVPFRYLMSIYLGSSSGIDRQLTPYMRRMTEKKIAETRTASGKEEEWLRYQSCNRSVLLLL